jgi:hypothetical protein
MSKHRDYDNDIDVMDVDLDEEIDENDAWCVLSVFISMLFRVFNMWLFSYLFGGFAGLLLVLTLKIKVL